MVMVSFDAMAFKYKMCTSSIWHKAWKPVTFNTYTVAVINLRLWLE